MRKYISDKIVGLSTDTKPTGMLPGAIFYEEDTLLQYLLVSGQIWLQLAASGITGTFSPQLANTIYAGPTGGAAANPTFRYAVSRDIPQNLSLNNLIFNVSGINYTNNLVSFDFDGAAYEYVVLTGNATFTGIHTQSGKTVTLKVSGDGTARALDYPAKYNWIGEAVRTGISANETVFITFTCFGTGDQNVWSVFAHQYGFGSGSSFYSLNNPSGFITASQTGQFYPTNNPSGFISSVAADIDNYVTGISISGSQPITGLAKFTGIGGTVVKYEGSGVISISGAGSATTDIDNYVTGLIVSGSNPITGAVTISGAGDNQIIYSSNNLIIISGTGGGGTSTSTTIINTSGLSYFTGVSGGQPGFLDSYATTGLATGYLSIAYGQTRLHYYLLRTGTDATTFPNLIRPTDFNSSTNAKIWQLHGFQLYNYAAAIEESGTISGNIFLDFNTAGFKTLNLNGNATLSGLNLGSGRMISFRMSGVTSDRTVTFPTKYKFFGAPRKTTVFANTNTVMSWTCFGNTDPDVSVSYADEYV